MKNYGTTGNSAAAEFPTYYSSGTLGFCVADKLDSEQDDSSGDSMQSYREEIVDYFNELTASRRNSAAKSTVALLNKLHERGYTVEDVKAVIRLKVKQWKDVDSMKKYLRPQTLFDVANFKRYLEESDLSTSKSDKS